MFEDTKVMTFQLALYDLNHLCSRMRKSRQEISDPLMLDQILANAFICRVAMMDGDLPYIVPFNYGYRDGCIYIHSAPKGKKIELIGKNKQVCFEVEEGVEILKGEKACDWSTRYRSVVGYGTMEILSDGASKQEGLEILMAQHGGPELNEFNAKDLDRMVILKLSISSLTGKQSSNWPGVQ